MLPGFFNPDSTACVSSEAQLSLLTAQEAVRRPLSPSILCRTSSEA